MTLFIYFKYIFRLLIKTGNVTAFKISHLQKSMNPNKYLYSYELLICFQSQQEFFLEKKMQESSVVCISELESFVTIFLQVVWLCPSLICSFWHFMIICWKTLISSDWNLLVSNQMPIDISVLCFLRINV